MRKSSESRCRSLCGGSRFLFAGVSVVPCIICAVVTLRLFSVAEGELVFIEGDKAYFPWFVNISDNQKISSVEWKCVDGTHSEKRIMLLRNGRLLIHPDYQSRLNRSYVNNTDVGMILSGVRQDDAPDHRMYRVVVTLTKGDMNSIQEMGGALSVLSPGDVWKTLSEFCKLIYGDSKEMNISADVNHIDLPIEQAIINITVSCDDTKVPSSNMTLTVFRDEHQQNTYNNCSRASSCFFSFNNMDGSVRKLRFQFSIGDHWSHDIWANNTFSPSLARARITGDVRKTLSKNCKLIYGASTELNITMEGHDIVFPIERAIINFTVSCDGTKVSPSNVTLTVYRKETQQNTSMGCIRATSCFFSFNNTDGDVRQLEFSIRGQCSHDICEINTFSGSMASARITGDFNMFLCMLICFTICWAG